MRLLQVDVTEYMFKLALLQRKYDQVIQMIRNSTLCGTAIIRCTRVYCSVTRQLQGKARTECKQDSRTGCKAAALGSSVYVDS